MYPDFHTALQNLYIIASVYGDVLLAKLELDKKKS